MVNPENLGQTWRESLFQTVIRFKRQRFVGKARSLFLGVKSFFFLFNYQILFLLSPSFFFFVRLRLRIQCEYPIIFEGSYEIVCVVRLNIKGILESAISTKVLPMALFTRSSIPWNIKDIVFSLIYQRMRITGENG